MQGVWLRSTGLFLLAALASGCPRPEGDLGDGGAPDGGALVGQLEWTQLQFPEIGACTPYQLRIAASGALSGHALAQLSLPADRGYFSSNSSCSAPTGSLALDGGAVSAIYLAAARTGPLSLTASIDGLGSARFDTDVRSGPPASVVFTVPPSAQYGDCLSGSVGGVDAAGNVLRGRGQSVSLSSASGGQLFASPDCSGSPTSSVTAALPDDGAVPFSFRADLVGNYLLVATLSPSEINGGQSVRMHAAPFHLAGAPATISGYSRTCLATPITLRKIDAFDGGEPFDGTETITLGGPAGLTFSKTSGCGTPAVQLRPVVGAATLPFWVRANGDAGTYVVSASDPELGTILTTVNVAGTQPVALRFVGVPDAGVRGDCIGAEVQLVDASGQPAWLVADSTLNLSSNTNTVRFWSDPGCTTYGSGPGVPAGTTDVPFWFSEPSNPASTLTATSTGGLGAVSKTVTFGDPAPGGILFDSSSYQLTTNSCQTQQIRIVSDAGVGTSTPNAETVTITAAPDAGLVLSLPGSGCTGTATSLDITVPAGGYAQSFEIKKLDLSSTTLTATAATLGTASVSISAVNPCRSYGAACDAQNPCCDAYGSPPIVCSSGTCQCNLSSCVPRGGWDCHSSNNCCSGAIMGTTCQ